MTQRFSMAKAGRAQLAEQFAQDQATLEGVDHGWHLDAAKSSGRLPT